MDNEAILVDFGDATPTLAPQATDTQATTTTTDTLIETTSETATESLVETATESSTTNIIETTNNIDLFDPFDPLMADPIKASETHIASTTESATELATESVAETAVETATENSATNIVETTDTVQSFDPFTPLAVNTLEVSSDPLVPNPAPLDPFDPLGTVNMADKPQEGSTNFEEQFADLVGDLGDKPTNGEPEAVPAGEPLEVDIETSTNGEAPQSLIKEIWPPQDPAKRFDEKLQSKTQDSDSSGAPSGDGGAPRLEDTLADYQPPRRVEKKEERDNVGPTVNIIPTDSKDKPPASKPNVGGAGANNMCKRCNKRVYEMEKMIADRDIYHKICFKCMHCKRTLSLGNYAAIDGQPYCKPHFIELFKKKGRYDMNSAQPRKEAAPPIRF